MHRRALAAPLLVVGLALGGAVGAQAQPQNFIQWDWFDKSAVGGAPWWSFVEQHMEKEWGVKLEMSTAWDESKVPVAIGSGVRIDGIQVPYHQARNWTDAGMLTSITEYLRRDNTVRMEQFIPGAFDAVTKGGQVYALPWIADFEILLLNVELWEQAGLDTRMTETWDWAQFVQVAKKLTAQDGAGQIRRVGYAAWLNRWTWATWLFTNGGNFFNQNQTAAAFNTPAGVQALNFLRELHLEHRVTLPGFEGEANFIAGRSGMLHTGPWVEAFHKFPMKLEFAMFPKGPQAQKPATTFWINYRAIPATAADKDFGWKFLSWYNSMRGVKYEMLGTHRSPWIPFYQSPQWRSSLGQNPHRRNWPLYLQMGKLSPVKGQENWSGEVNRLITEAIQGSRAPTDALMQSERIVNAALQGR